MWKKSINLKLSLTDFEEVRVLGVGGFGQVVLVQKREDKKLFAMKIMQKKDLVSQQKIQQILNER